MPGQTWNRLPRRPALVVGLLLVGLSGTAVPSAAGVTAAVALPRLDVADTTAVEGNVLNGPMTWSVRLSEPAAGAVSFTYSALASTGDTATPGEDFVRRVNRVISLEPGQISRTISIDTKGDTVPEWPESYSLVIEDITGATAGRVVARGTILDDDPARAGDLGVNDTAVYEGNDKAGVLLFQVRLAAPSTTPVSFSWRTVDGTATVANGDYLAATGTVTIPEGERSARLQVKVPGDLSAEARETLSVRISNPSTGRITRSTGTGRIVDDD